MNRDSATVINRSATKFGHVDLRPRLDATRATRIRLFATPNLDHGSRDSLVPQG